MMSDGSGETLPGSLLTWNPDTCSWRTSPDLFGSDFLTSAPTLPGSGSMRNGRCIPQPPLVPRTDANGSGSWPDGWGTPTARDDQKSPEAHMAMKAAMQGGARTTPTSLTVQAKMWPTPKASEGMRGTDPRRPGREGGDSLLQAVNSWPTPTTRDAAKSGGKEGSSNVTLTDAAVRGRLHQQITSGGNDGSPRADLNPRFVAALMGLPWDWLMHFTSEETDSSPKPPVKRSASSGVG